MPVPPAFDKTEDAILSAMYEVANPHDELVDNGNYCLAQPGEIYAI